MSPVAPALPTKSIGIGEPGSGVVSVCLTARRSRRRSAMGHSPDDRRAGALAACVIILGNVMRHVFPSLMLILVCAVLGSAQGGFVDGVQMTTVKAPWTLRILGQDLDIDSVQAKPDEASAYFMTSSRTSEMNVSVFIEPVDKCKSSNECRDYVLALGNPAWGKFQDVVKGKTKDFSYFEFYVPVVNGEPLKMQEMYAEFVSNGYWVDIHMSKALYEKKDHALFEAVLNAAKFVSKPEAVAEPFGAEITSGENGGALWLTLWDAVKCPESYRAMAAITRAAITEKDWTEYCTTYAGEMGKNSSRKLLAAAFTSSLPTKTDLPVAVLAYQSDFANKAGAIELVALTREKDGKWTVTNHLFR